MARALTTAAEILARLRTIRASCHQPGLVVLAERRDRVGVEAVEHLAERLALVEDRRPGQPGLERLQREPLEVRRLAVDPVAPLGVVVVAHHAGAAGPRAAGDAVLADDAVPSAALLEPRVGQRRRRDRRQVVADRDAEPAVGVPAVRRAGPATPRGRRRPPRGCGRRSSTTSRSPRRTAGRRAAAAAPARRTASRREPRRAGRHVGELVLLGLDAADRDDAGVDQHAVLERRVDVERAARCRRSSSSSAPSSGVAVGDRRGVAEQRAEEDPRLPALAGDRGRARSARSPGRRRGPTSGSATQSWAPCSAVVPGRRDLGVADAVAGGHQVELAGPDHRVVAGAVAVLDLAGEQPAHRLQPGVRVRRDAHAAGVGDVVGAVVVEEAPGADQRALPLRAACGVPSSPAARRAAPRAAPAPRPPAAARPRSRARRARPRGCS